MKRWMVLMMLVLATAAFARVQFSQSDVQALYDASAGHELLGPKHVQHASAFGFDSSMLGGIIAAVVALGARRKNV